MKFLIGALSQPKDSQQYYLTNIESILFCAKKYVPPELFNKQNSNHLMLQQQCDNWRLEFTPSATNSNSTNNSSTFVTVHGMLGYYVDNTATRTTEYISKESNAVQHNTSEKDKLKVKKELFEAYTMLRNRAILNAALLKSEDMHCGLGRSLSMNKK
jgi:hypothetical protein